MLVLAVVTAVLVGGGSVEKDVVDVEIGPLQSSKICPASWNELFSLTQTRVNWQAGSPLDLFINNDPLYISIV